MGKYRYVSRIAGELELKGEQIDQLMERITTHSVFKRDRSYYGNAEILLGFLLNSILKRNDKRILDDVLSGNYNDESLRQLNGRSYSTYLLLTA
ncbi:hypothetical protein [Halalkalibacter okhensis]|uniref:Uncharacterized protein n=1 Tax=Halalkalibacter okhensis TaxID=333138 RepID=A0A0B0IKU5_9BACI|nr:hypothetical protein [Halalkalibacter okhensis]KHF40689.1 hypothetical protein LQ50_07790 [Halalkalibacter okhensis]